ncbi:MAG: amidase family protein [Myxococcota bacterium]|jgi:amidase
MNDYAEYDGLGLAELVKTGAVSPAELVEEAIARIEKHDGALNAVVYRAFEEARRDAGGELPEGSFRGVPFLVKDLGCPVAGMPRTSGSRFLKDEVPAEDGELTKRFRATGVVIVGKTNTPEHGITGTTESALLGPCRNPWNPDHIAGGSSGGAASATAAGMVPLAHASDGLGSIRIPAACCGLFGVKPTRDRNPNTAGGEDRDRVNGMSVDHVVSRSVRDSAAMLDATGYPENASPYAVPAKDRPYLDEVTTPPGTLRIAFSGATPGGRPIDPEIREALEATAELLVELGHEVEERDIDIDWRGLYRAQGATGAANLAAGVEEMTERIGRAPEEDDFERLTWSSVKLGRKLDGVTVMQGLRTLRTLAREILAFYDTCDVMLTPVLGTVPPPVGFIDPVNLEPREVQRRQGRTFPFTPPVNITGQPAMSMPLATSTEGLPIGMHFIARYADEATLFRLAGQLEEARPWRDRRPPIFG